MSRAPLELDRDAFLTQYWQRRPLLIRNSDSVFETPLQADELAGLALEEFVESRIIEHRDGRWQQHSGPFCERDFQRDTPWTLLVQAVDHYVPAVSELRELVDFLPGWRVDDVMVSYASDGGSVGPHYDNYDVFLLQGEGQRRWRLGQLCDGQSPLLPHDSLRILRDFECMQEYLLEPGDMLYVPPGVAHWGVAQGECTTFSIGFRAPRINDMVSRWADSLLEQMDPELFYSDSDSEPVSLAGEIRPADLARVRAQLRDALQREDHNHWFGALVTEPRYDCTPQEDDLARTRAGLAGGTGRFALSPAARVAWQREEDGIVVFANGETRIFNNAVLDCLVNLCKNRPLEGKQLSRDLARPGTAELLDYLIETGSIDDD